MKNIKLLLQFAGTAYHGWQIQPRDITVQGVLEEALLKTTGKKISVAGCSRTDAGVHAMYYVCSFKTDTSIPTQKLPFALNSQLPEDIVCLGAEEAEPNFHAIASAKRKRYIYKIENSYLRNPFNANRVWHYKGKLDYEEMCEAATHFLGTHDFSAFAASGFSAKTTIRTIYDISVNRDENIITVDITGNGFLYNMVRIITGTLVWVGAGKINSEDIPKIIESKKREYAGITAPPEGLYLWRVEY